MELNAFKTPEVLGAFEFRVTDRDGNPWFVLADVCRVLEIANSRDAASPLGEDERVKIDLSRGVTITDGAKINDLGVGMGNSEAWLVNEAGLYSLDPD